MKLIYLSTARIPDDWAHVIQILKMCEGFGSAGAEVELVVPKRARTRAENPFTYAGVVENFTITKLPCVDLFPGTQSRLFYGIRTLSFFISAKIYLAFKKYDVLYTREKIAGVFFKDFIYEIHTVSEQSSTSYKARLLNVRGAVVLTSFIKDAYAKEGIKSENIIIAPDAVTLREFDIEETREEARIKLGIPNTAYVIGYTGTLMMMGMERGIREALEALNELPENVEMYIVGGEPGEVVYYQKEAEQIGVSGRVHFIGKVPHDAIPLYLRAFDVVIVPLPDFPFYRYYTSPLKIFEYMASGKPIVSSDLPSLREVLDEDTAVLVAPGDARALAEGLTRVMENEALGKKIREAAFQKVQNYTWEKRAKTILTFIESLPDRK